MKKIFLLFPLLAYLSANTCTTFFLHKNGQMVFGRNYDWMTDAGMICTNPRGLFKTSMKTQSGETISWVSQCGSITFNQYGKEFPTGGMNEKGLVVELMWLDETQYPTPDTRPAIGVLQWIQYQLDNCATVDEVIATDKKLRISSTGTTPLHYLVADASGHVATIEFLNGKMVVNKGTDLAFPVLTNSVYSESAKLYKTAAANGEESSFGSGDNSLERFGKACSMVKQYLAGNIDKPVTDYAFDILKKVAQGSFTKWSIVYDLTNRAVHFRTERFGDIKTIHFAGIDFNCAAGSKALDMNQKVSGDITSKMEKFTPELNRRIVEMAFKESNSEIRVDEKTRQAAWQYAGGISCQ
jgi:penicillin V acylase-like amidase (Ntn superfamily)